MRRFVPVSAASLMACLVVIAPSAAQQRPNPTVNVLRGEDKIRYLGKQLFLNEQQQADYEEYVKIWVQAFDEATERVRTKPELIRDLFGKLRDARQAGNEQVAADIEKQISLLTPGRAADAAFDTAVKDQLLTEEQWKLLAKARARLEANPSGELTMIDVFHTARDTGLNGEQKKKYAELMKTYRQRMFKEVIPSDTIARSLLREELVNEMRDVLTPEQRKAYDRQINALRVNPAPTDPATPKEETDKG